MKQMEFADAVSVSGTRTTADGYLVADCRVARTGIQLYYGHEIGEGQPNQEFRVYRPETEVFKKDSLQSYAFRPITLGHPPEGVTADNWKKTAVGTVGGDVARDGEFVRVPMLIADAGAIKAVADGTRQISMGYVCDLVMQKGTTPDGEPYDAIQTNLKMNHAAIVPAGRAGPGARIGDSSARIPQQKDTPMTKTVTIDGKQHEVADDVAAHLAKLQADNKAQADTLKEAATALDASTAVVKQMKADKDASDKAAADAKAAAEKAEAEKKSAADIHAMAADLAATMDSAKKIAPDLDTKGKTADAIRKEAVSKKLGDEAVKGKDQAYFNLAFDLLTSDAKGSDPVADALRGGSKTVGDEGDKAFNDYKANLSTAWQTPVAKN